MRIEVISLAALLALTACTDSDTDGTDTMDTMDTGMTILPEGVSCEGTVCRVSGTITESFTMDADHAWLLQGGVFIGDDNGNDAVLTIEPGTTVYGETSTDGFLVISRGSKIMAEGTAEAPIVFTSSKEEGSRATGDWGGLMINGRAPTNACGDSVTDPADCSVEGEGGSGQYGGGDVNDDSGVLKYVRVEFGGTLINDTNEVNGIAFQGVGAGTTVDYIQVHQNADDGIEFFGGTVNVKHVLLTGAGDDLMDWTDGWQGKAQFVIAQNYEGVGDNGIEADNNGDGNNFEPRSAPMIANITLIGMGTSDIGMLLREGTAANITHAISMGWNDWCMDIDHVPTFDNAWDGEGLNGELTVENSFFDCPATPMFNAVPDVQLDESDNVIATAPFTTDDFVRNLNVGNQFVDPMLEDAFNELSPNFAPKSGSPVLGVDAVDFGGFFEAVDYAGAIGADDWTAGWTTSAAN